MDEPHDDTPHPIGWGRAILTSVLIAIVGAAVLVYGANALLTRVHSLDRHARVGIATGAFLVVIAVLAWALRRLQARGLI